MSIVPDSSAAGAAGSVNRGSAATPGSDARAACCRIRAARSRAATALTCSSVTIKPAPSGTDRCSSGVRIGVHVSSATATVRRAGEGRVARRGGRASLVLTAINPTTASNPNPAARTRYDHIAKEAATPAPPMATRTTMLSASLIARYRAASPGEASSTARRSERSWWRSFVRASRSNSRRWSAISRADIWFSGVFGRIPSSWVVAAIRRASRSMVRVSARSRRFGARYSNQSNPPTISVRVGPSPLFTFSTVNRKWSNRPQARGWCVVQRRGVRTARRSTSGMSARLSSAVPLVKRESNPPGTSSIVTAKQKWSRQSPSMWM